MKGSAWSSGRARVSVALALGVAALAFGPVRADDEAPGKKRPKRPTSVIFLIGDGMGLSQVTLGRLAAQQLGRPYNFDRFEVIGLSSCRSANYVVTDSAAAATALASGIKTNNQSIGLDPRGHATETILELANRAGFATGLVTTTRITHATPACFDAHEGDRDNEAPIASQMVAAAVSGGYPQVLIGGGTRFMTPALQATLREAGYEVVLDPTKVRPAPKVAAFLAPSHIPFAIERPAGHPTLAQLTRAAVESLALAPAQADGPRPFFLMVEGGRIDHACHQHDAPAMVHDQLDFDEAVGYCLDQAQSRDDLLVVVTADHATADLGITEYAQVDKLLACTASSEMLTDAKVDPTDASQAAAFVAAVQQRTGVALTQDEVAVIWSKGDKYWARTLLGHVVSSRYGVEFYDPALQEARMTNTHGHDGAMVGVFAAGRGAKEFAGVYENTEIPRRMSRLMGLHLPRVAVPPIGSR